MPRHVPGNKSARVGSPQNAAAEKKTIEATSARIYVPRALRRVVFGRRFGAGGFVGDIFAGNRVGARKPFAEIDITASVGTEREAFVLGDGTVFEFAAALRTAAAF